MDETHVILLLAVIAVLVLAVAVVILLPKEKLIRDQQDDEKKHKGKKGKQQPKLTKQEKKLHALQNGQPDKPSINLRAQKIKGFDEIEEPTDAKHLLEFLKGKDVHLNTAPKKEDKKRSDEVVASQNEREPVPEGYTTIKGQEKKKIKEDKKGDKETRGKKEKTILQTWNHSGNEGR